MALRTLSHFELIDELGSGGMGVVYRALDTELRRQVAIKTLPPACVGDAARSRLLREARATSSLNHPGIVTIYEVGSADGIDFIAMELVEGRTLTELLADGPLPERRVRAHARQLAEALAAAHRAGVIHRDLKPANVVVTAEDRLKILDFGLAKRVAPADLAKLAELTTLAESDRTTEGTILGTPAYMSPEQARGRPADARSDLFSLGCILYEELTGERPFRGEVPLEILTALLRDTPEAPSRRRRGLSARWDPLLRRLLERDPEARFASAEAFAAELRERFPDPEPAADAARRRRRLAVGATLAAATLALGAFVLWRVLPRRSVASAGAGPVAFEFRLVSDFPGSHREPSLAPDGSAIAFVSEDEAGVPQIWVRALAGGDAIQITHGTVPARSPTWARKGDRILFGRRGEGLWQVPPLGGTARRLVDVGDRPQLSPDGSRLVFVHDRLLWLAAGDGSDAQPLETLPASYFGRLALAAFAPDGAQLVAYWPRPDRPFGDLWRVDLEGGAARQLTDLEFSPGGAVAWSADGRWIYFASDHGGSTTLWRVAPEGGEPSAVTSGAGEDTHPTLSANGQRIAYTNTRNSWHLVRYRPDGGERTVLLEQRRAIMLPRLAPDGRRVAFFARAPHSHHLFLLDIESGAVEQLSYGDRVINVAPRWLAGGEALLYYREAPEPSLRRIRSDGREDELVLPEWRWTRENYALPSPDGTRLLYTLIDDGRAMDTRIHDLTSSRARSLPEVLYGAEWTASGEAIVGTREADESILRCQLAARTCEPIGEGWYPRLSRDGHTLYALRFGPPRIWRRDVASGREEALAGLEGFDLLHFNWSLAPDGSLVYPEKLPGRQELWLGETVAVAAGADGGN